MAAEPLGTILRHIRGLVASRCAEGSTDAQLLERFTGRQDQDAFAALVRRHGPVVWGVCQRVLGHEQDAEDAFQATFLVLARKAASVHRAAALGSWLHGAAYRSAREIQRKAARRRVHERRVASMPQRRPEEELSWREVQAVLDEEVQRLAMKYRAPFVLCCLEGQSKAEAARQLGWKEGTLSGRLARARQQLQQRLARRGVLLSALLTTAALSQPASRAAVPASVVDAVVKAAVPFAAGGEAGSEIAAGVAAVAQRVARAMLVSRLHTALGLLLSLGLVSAGVGVLAHQARVAEPAGAQQSDPGGAAARGADATRSAEAEPARTERNDEALPAWALARLGTLRFRHGDAIKALAFAPDGRMLASAAGRERGTDQTIRLWETATGKELRRLPGHPGGTYALAFAPDGKLLASGGRDGAVRLWDGASGALVRSLQGQQRWVRSVAFAPDGKVLASGGQAEGICLWDVAAGHALRRLTGYQGEVGGLVFTPDGQQLISGSSDHTVRLWDVATGRELRQFGRPRQAKGACVALSPDGRLLASADGEVYLWETATGRELGQIGRPTDVSAHYLAFAPDGNALAAIDWGGTVRLWDVRTNRELLRLNGPHGIGACVAFAPDGKLLAAGGGENTVRLWEMATGKERFAARGQQGPVSWVGFALDGKTAISAGWGDVLRVWDLAAGPEPLAADGRQGEPLAPALLGSATPFALTPDGRAVAVVDAAGKPYFLDAATGEARDPFPVYPPTGGRGFTPDGKWLLLLGRDMRTVAVWSLAGGREVRRFTAYPSFIDALAVSPDGKLLAVSGERRTFIRPVPGINPNENTVRLWDLATGKEVRRLTGRAHALAFSPDGRRLAGAGMYDTVRLWDVASGKELRPLAGHGGYVRQVAFSPDGKALASAGSDHTVRLWELATGQERRRFLGHEADVSCVAFSPDGRRLLSGGADTQVLLWDVAGPPRDGRPSRGRDSRALWDDLAREDAARAYDALCTLVATPQQTLPFLKAVLRPVATVEPERIARLIRDLDSDRFAVRKQAMDELREAGEQAAPALRRLLEGKPSLELRQRAEQLLAGLEPAALPERLRALRAIEVLERIGTPEARRLLEALAGGAPAARITEEARAALGRLVPGRAGRLRPALAEEPPARSAEVLREQEGPRTDRAGKPLPPRAVARFGGKSKLLLSLAFSPDGQRLLVGDGSPVLRLWDRATGEPAREFQAAAGDLGQAALSPDGKTVAAATRQGSRELALSLWDVASGRELRRLPTRGRAVFALRFAPDGKRLLTGDEDRKLHLWDVAAGTEIRAFGDHLQVIWCLAWAPDGRMVASGEPSALWLWDVGTGRLLRRLGPAQGPGAGASSLAFDPSGRLLANGGNGVVSFWDPATGKEVLRLDKPEMGGVFDLAFSPDGRTLATASWDGQVRLWELATGRVRCQLTGHGERVTQVAFSPDGRTVASGAIQGPVLLWDITGQAPDGRLQPVVLAAKDLKALWGYLVSDRAPEAYRAIWKLVAAGPQAVGFLRQHLRPIPTAYARRLDPLLADLQSESGAVADAAARELERLGELAGPALREALAGRPPAAARARIEYLLDRAGAPSLSGERLRDLRAVEVLEQVGTPEARRLLEALARGAPAARLTREAQAALGRLGRRQAATSW